MKTGKTMIAAALLVGLTLQAQAAKNDVILVEKSKARAVVCVPAGLMADDVALPKDAVYSEQRDEQQRRRLRDSVHDLVHYVEVMSGAKLDVVEGRTPATKKLLPIYVGSLAAQVFGPPAKSYPHQQGWRLVVGDKGIGLIGESDLAVSYALYEVLHRLGCRWYMPGELGECIPQSATLALTTCDLSTTPSTVWRGLWYPGTRSTLGPGYRIPLNTNEPFNRRNRQGGLPLWAAHNLEKLVTAEQREAHPEWRAIVNGKPHAVKLKWTRPEVAEAISQNLIAQLDKVYQPVLCLAPSDSTGWDESEDPAHDGSDWDEALGVVSKTDRLLILLNRIAARVVEKYPEVKFTTLIYVDYTRPPVREPVHPALIPYIAPITYNRAHPMDWPNHANGTQVYDIVKGWQKASENLGYYWYAYNLSETWAPNPLITKWGHDLPILFGPDAKYPSWFPETMGNFETTQIGLYMGMRLSWDASQNPDDLVAELIENFYGAAAEPMSRYWHHFDQAWVTPPDYSGAAFGYRRRFTPDVLKQARVMMDEALAACKTIPEYRRVVIADDSLRQFERFMKMEENLAEGRYKNLAKDFERWWNTSYDLDERYRDNFAFIASAYYRQYWIEIPHGRVFREATRLDTEFTPMTKKPLKAWHYQADTNGVAEQEGWLKPDTDSTGWKTTDVTVDTWSYLGYHNYMGKMVYRTELKLPTVPSDKHVYLWLARFDGSAQVFVNGVPVPLQSSEGESKMIANGYAASALFDITAAVQPNKKNDMAILCERQGLNELGIGGLLGPVMIYRDK